MKRVLVLTHEDDPHANVVCSYLDKSKIIYFRVDTDRFSERYNFSFDSRNLEFRLSSNDQEIVIDPSWNIWNRRVIDPEINSDVENENLRQIIRDETKAMWMGLLSSHEGLVVNNPYNNLLAGNKINQLIFAEKFGRGICIPETLLTNDAEEAEEFWKEYDRVCFKLQKGAVVEKENTQFVVFTNIVEEEHMKNRDLIRKHPHLFQRYQDKTYEVRVVTIGEVSMGTAIYSQKSERSKIDFRRYDFDNVPYEPIGLPEEVSEFCNAMLNNYGLHFGVFDFVYSEDRGYTFLEINPNGQWLWLEEYSGYPIAKEVSNYL